MPRRHGIVARLSLSVLLLVAQAIAGEQAIRRLKPGDSLPPISGQALTGKVLDLPSVAGGSPGMVIFSFSRTGGRDAQTWTQRLMKDYPHLAIYTVIFLESVPRLFRPMAVSGIKREMPTAMQDQTVLLYRDENVWEQRLQITDQRHACLILIGPNGRIQWVTSEPFADAPYLQLSQQIRALN